MYLQRAVVFMKRLSVAALLLLLGVQSAPVKNEVWPPCAAAPCSCSPDGTTAYCEALDSRVVPSQLPANLKTLLFTAHSLRVLDNNTFASLPQLEHLDLSEGRISEVLEGALSTLPRLRQLSLSNNELTYLPAGAFADSPALQALDLSGNPLVLPSVGPFLRSDSLQELSLNMCGLSRVEVDSFEKLPQLRRLNLADNSLLDLKVERLRNLAKLSWLRVDEGALANDTINYLNSRGVDIDVLPLDMELLDDGMQDDNLTSQNLTGVIYLGFLDWDYQVEAEVKAPTTADEKGPLVPENQSTEDGEAQTGTPAKKDGWWRPRWPPRMPWRYLAYAALLGAVTCGTAALSYWATLLAIRHHRGRQAAQKPRETLDRAFCNVANLPAYRQLQTQGVKGQPRPKAAAVGYERLVDEDDGAWLPPRAQLREEPCSCLSCSEPVPTQPCIRHYSSEQPTGVHGPVPHTLYTQ